MPIIAMIANAFAEDVQKCLDAGDCSLESALYGEFGSDGLFTLSTCG